MSARIIYLIGEELGHTLSRAERASQTAQQIECDHYQDPAVRAAVAVLTGDTQLAERWCDLRADIREIEGWLGYARGLLAAAGALPHPDPNSGPHDAAPAGRKAPRTQKQPRSNGAAPSTTPEALQ